MKRLRRLTVFILLAVGLVISFGANAAVENNVQPDTILSAEGKVVFNLKYANQLLEFFSSIRKPFISKNFDELDARSDYRNMYLHLLADTNYPRDPFIDSPEGVLLWNSIKLYYGNKAFLDAYVRALQYVEKNALIARYKTWNACKVWFEAHSKKIVDFMDTYDKAYEKTFVIAKGIYGGIISGTEEPSVFQMYLILEKAGLSNIHTDRDPLTPDMRNRLQDIDNHVNAVRRKSEEFKKQGEELQVLVTVAQTLHKEVEAMIQKEAAKGNANQSTFGQKVMTPDRRVLERLEELARACIDTYSYFEKDENTRLLITHEIARKYISLASNASPNISYVEKFIRAHKYIKMQHRVLVKKIVEIRERKRKK